MTDSDLCHSAQITVQLRAAGRFAVPGQPSGFVTLKIEDASAADVLAWLEIPLSMLRDQAKESAC